MKHMDVESMNLEQVINESVDHLLFERGWIDQTPHEFVVIVEEDIFKALSQMSIAPPRTELKKSIMKALKKRLDGEYDINIFRLKNFPSETHQRFDV